MPGGGYTFRHCHAFLVYLSFSLYSSTRTSGMGDRTLATHRDLGCSHTASNGTRELRPGQARPGDVRRLQR